MDDKKKIVLGSEDFLSKGNEDIFINLNLQKTFKGVKKEKYDNNFDLTEQFRKERNASKSFRVYGIIDSKITDCDNLTLRVYSDSSLNNLIKLTSSSSIGFGDKNVFGKFKGKYIIELNNYTNSNTIYIKISGDGVNFADTVIEQKLVFYGVDGEYIEYGTETVNIGFEGFSTIDNDFPFFYNKHWVKNNFQIERQKIRNVSFSQSLYTVFEGDSETISISLNKPSAFGNESVVIQFSNPFSAKFVLDFSVNSPFSTFPITLNWSAGEQIKNIDISAVSDSINENTENFVLVISSPLNVTTDSGNLNIDTTTINIINQN